MESLSSSVDAARIAWTDGSAALLSLTPVQEGMRRARLRNWKKGRRSVDLAARRLGKSHGYVADVDAFARGNADSLQKYAASTSISVRDFILPIFRAVLEDCPKDLQPIWNEQRGEMLYRNGSVVMIHGCDTVEKAWRLRGMSCDRAFVDEAAFIKLLEYVCESILIPQLMTTDGHIQLGSSAPDTPAAPYVAYLCHAAGFDEVDLSRLNALPSGDHGTLVKRVLYDATHIPRDRIDEFVNEAGGKHSTTARREYFCEVVIDESRAVVPEIAHGADQIFLDVDIVPEHRAKYVGWDTGHLDLTIGAFGYYDQRNRVVVVEDECVIQRATSFDIAQAGKDMEVILWGADPEHPCVQCARGYGCLLHTPRDRVADAPPMVLADMMRYGYQCRSPRKDAEASIQRLRDAVKDRKLRISSKCKTIRQHLEGAVWNVSGKDMERVAAVGTEVGHHFDGLDALRYLLDSVDTSFDATPPPNPEKGGGYGLLASQGTQSGLGKLTMSPRRALSSRIRGGR